MKPVCMVVTRINLPVIMQTVDSWQNGFGHNFWARGRGVQPVSVARLGALCNLTSDKQGLCKPKCAGKIALLWI